MAEPLRLGIPSLVYRRVDPGFPHDADTQTRSVLSENGETPRGPLRLFTPRARLPGPTPSTWFAVREKARAPRPSDRMGRFDLHS